MDATYAGPPASSYELANYLAMLRRHWWVLLLTVLLGGAAAAGYDHRLPREYVATGSVLVHPSGLDSNVTGGRTRDEINLDTEAQLMRSTAVVGGAAKLLGSTDLEALATNVSVEVPPNTSVLEVKFAAGTPEAAQAGAHAFSRAYLANREQNAKADLDSQIAALTSKIAELNSQLGTINGKLAFTRAGTSAHASLDSQRDTLVSQLNSLNNKINQLGTETVSGGAIIREARLPGRPTKPRTPLNLAAGGMLGLLAGLGLAALRDSLDRRVRGGLDLRRMDVPILSEVGAKAAPRFDDVFAPFSEGGRAFNRLRNEVVAALLPGQQVVVVTGASRGAAATLVAANLAAALARTGTEVVLIGAHLPDSLVHGAPLARLLGVAPGPGLSEVLAGRSNLAEATQRTARNPSLHVITTGGTASAAGLMQSQALRDTIATLRAHADYLVIEAPSTASGADAQSLASLADVAIVAVEQRRTRRPEVADAAEQLRRVGTPLLGAVLMPRVRMRPMPVEEVAAASTALAPDTTGALLLTKPRDDCDDSEVPAGSNGHKRPGEDTILLAAVDVGELAELDEAHGR